MEIDETARTWHADATLPESTRQRLLREDPTPVRTTAPRRFSPRLVVAGGALAMIGLTTTLWYRGHYTLPPTPQRLYSEPHPNGYHTAVEACQLEVRMLDGIKTSPERRELPQPLDGRKRLRAANEPSIKKLREALGQVWLSPAYTDSKQTFPEYAKFREEARMLTMAAQTYADEGDLANAARCGTDAVSVGVRMPRGGVLITSLVGVACEAIGERSLWDLLERMDAATARATATRLVALEQRRTSYSEILKEEKRYCQLSRLQLFEGGVFRSWKALDQEFDFGPMDTVMIRDEDKPKFSDKLRIAWTKTKAIYYGPRVTIEAIGNWLDALSAQEEQPWQANRVAPPAPSDPLNERAAPVFAEVGFRFVAIRATRQLLIASLALRAYRLEKGHPAPSLEALVHDGYLVVVPTDPFSPTRAALRYSDGKLWSVGPDAKDDAGRPTEGRRGYITKEQHGDLVAGANT